MVIVIVVLSIRKWLIKLSELKKRIRLLLPPKQIETNKILSKLFLVLGNWPHCISTIYISILKAEEGEKENKEKK